MSGDEEKKKPAGRQVGGIRSQYATLGGGPKPIEPQSDNEAKRQNSNAVLPQNDNPVIPQKDNTAKQESSNAVKEQNDITVLPQNDNAEISLNSNTVKQKKPTKTDERVKLTFYVDPEDVVLFDDLRYQYNRRHGARLDQNKFMRLIMKNLNLSMLKNLSEGEKDGD